MEAAPGGDADEREGHGHRHRGNHLQDLLTFGHTHDGCGCGAGLPTDAIVWLPMFYGDAIVLAWAVPSVSDGPSNHPFRPPIV